MQIHYSFDNIGKIANPVVTTGAFDGVHIGHKTIINRINFLAKQIEGESVLITFFPHPRKVLFPNENKNLFFINSQREKIELLGKTGLDHLFIITFTLEFANTSSEDFVRKLLVEKLGAKIIVVGFNHHFGHNREGNYENLRKIGDELKFEVEEIPEQDIEHEAVSSTRIRKALIEGYIQRANAYLDHQYIIIGNITSDKERYCDFNLKIYNISIEEEEKLIPPAGIYATNIILGNQSFRAMAIVSKIGESDICSGRDSNVDINLIDTVDYSIEDELISVYFYKRITIGFSNNDRNKLKIDITSAKNLIEELIY